MSSSEVENDYSDSGSDVSTSTFCVEKNGEFVGAFCEYKDAIDYIDDQIATEICFLAPQNFTRVTESIEDNVVNKSVRAVLKDSFTFTERVHANFTCTLN